MLRDLKIVMDGKDNTYIDLESEVSDKSTILQSSMILAVTKQNSDTLFKQKGTSIVAGLLNNNVLNKAYSQHTCNFASLDIYNFLQDNMFVLDNDITVSGIEMSVLSYNPFQSTVQLEQIVKFSDGTQTIPVTQSLY